MKTLGILSLITALISLSYHMGKQTTDDELKVCIDERDQVTEMYTNCFEACSSIIINEK